MTPLRKFFYGLAVILTGILLLQLPYAFATTSVLGDSKTIGAALEESGAYERFVPLVIEDLSKNSDDEQTRQILADKGVQDAINSSITKDDVKTSAQSIIDGVYAWLEGKTKTPVFSVDLSKSSEELKTKLSAYAEQRSASLPACTLEQLRTVNFENNVLSIPCLPPGVTPTQIGQRFSQQATEEIDFLKNPVITNETVFKQSEAQQFEKDTAGAPRTYQNLQKNKWFTLALVIIMILLLILGRRNRMAGVKVVARTMIVVGIFLGLLWLLVSSTDTKNLQGSEVAKIALTGFLYIAERIMNIVKWFALGYIGLGVGTLVYLRRLNSESELVNEPVSVESDNTDTSSPESSDK